VQVVDFANHDEAGDDLCGVTVGLDPDLADTLPDDPEAAFRALIARFPTVARQFEGATVVGAWTDTTPWRSRVAATHGPRHVAIERAAVRTDEFLSRDITVAVEVVHALAAAVLRVVRDGATAGPQFERVARFQAELIDFNDRMLTSARIACRDFQLWNAYSRVWLLWQILAHLSLKRATADGGAAPPDSWQAVERFDSALWFQTPAGLAPLLDWFFEQCTQVQRGVLTPGAAAGAIFKALRRARFVPPLYRFGAPGARYYHFTMARRLLMLAWVKTIAPSDFKRLLSRDNVTGRRSAPPPLPASTPPPDPVPVERG
jgi:FADH2 O2-dependent halogenase